MLGRLRWRFWLGIDRDFRQPICNNSIRQFLLHDSAEHLARFQFKGVSLREAQVARNHHAKREKKREREVFKSLIAFFLLRVNKEENMAGKEYN